MAENLEYQDDLAGYERAKDNLRRLRAVRARTSLLADLRSGAEIRFLLEEPQFEPMRIEVPAPRWHGVPSAPHVLVAFHGLGCVTCTRGSKLVQTLMAARPGQFRVLAGDYFEPGQLDAYRGALALHCAPPPRRDALLEALVSEFKSAEITWLSERAETAAGIADPRYRDCLSRDRMLPLIVENVAMAARLGLSDNIPGLFASGVRIGDLNDVAAVLSQIDAVVTRE